MSNSNTTPEYLKSAIKPNPQGEATNLKNTQYRELLPTPHKIPIHREFETNDPIILEWYSSLAKKGQFGIRLGHLMALDAYGKVKETTDIAELSTEEKIDKITEMVVLLTKNLSRTQYLTENTIASQTKTLNLLQNVGTAVQGHEAVLSAIEACLISEKHYSPKEIKLILDGIRKQIMQLDKASSRKSEATPQPRN